MRKVINPARADWDSLCRRPDADCSEMKLQVEAIVKRVRSEKDAAVREYSRSYDGVYLSDFLVPQAAFTQAQAFVSEEFKRALSKAAKNIEIFHRAHVPSRVSVEISPGVSCWSELFPIESVGLYIPGGSAPLVSTLLMLGVPAKIAGCEQIVVCSPPFQGENPHPAILYAAKFLGIERVYRVGGAHAIAAMAFGTQSIRRVDKLFGPGNQYVTLAKQIAGSYGVAIDMPAGPSEVLVIADDTAHPAWVAADLLSQAEHGPDSQVILVSSEEHLVDSVIREIDRQIQKLPRAGIARKALTNSLAIICSDIEEAIRFSNRYAPEHLILAVSDSREIARYVRNAGSVFLGHSSPEVAGDYASGTNHVLPTGGAARAWSGVGLDSFMKRITFQELSAAGLGDLRTCIVELAQAEGLEAHAQAVIQRCAV